MLCYFCMYLITMSPILTKVLIVLCFVSFPTKQGSSSFPEKALSRAGDVEVRCRETAAGRQCLWHKALCGQKSPVRISILKTSSSVVQTKSTKQNLTCERNSCCAISSSRGRSAGSRESMLAMSCLAGSDKEEGKE